jgi:hypothetical protein
LHDIQCRKVLTHGGNAGKVDEDILTNVRMRNPPVSTPGIVKPVQVVRPAADAMKEYSRAGGACKKQHGLQE